jgi:hypothetical protein
MPGSAGIAKRMIKKTMLNTRSIVGGLLIALALSALAATSATAAQETRYFVEGSELTTAETIDGAIGVTQLSSTVAGAKFMIECVANELVPTGNNTIEKEGKSNGEVTYKQCYFYVITKGIREFSTTCRVKEPITFDLKGQLIPGPGGLVEGEGKPSTGTIFVEIVIEKIPGKTCLLEKTYKAEGTYVASGGAEGERALIEHEIIAHSTGSKITFGGEPATYRQTSSRIKLRNGKSFY